MATPRFAWGIDIGNRALKAVKLVSSGGTLAIDEFDIVEHETVLSEAGDNRDSLIQTALATFVARHGGIEKGVVAVGVSAQRAFAKFVALPPVEKKKIPEIVKFEAMQQIPFTLAEVEWSYTLFEDPASPDVEVGIFAMKKELVNQQIKFFTDAKLNVQVVQMNPLAVYNAMYYDSRIKGTTMIVDLGAENTDLVIAEGESVWMRSIPIGGNSFTEALTKAFKVNFDKAEELKRNAQTSKYGRQIMQAMRPIFADLVSEIQRSIGFYSSVHKESRVSRVLALGSTFRLPGLQKYLEQNLTMPVEKLDRLGTGAIEDPKTAAAFSENLLSAAGAYGLALQAMGQGKINASLLPEHIRMEKMWQEKTKWFGAAAALFLVGTAVGYGRYFVDDGIMKNGEHGDLVTRIESVERDAKDLDEKWSKIESDGAPDRQRLLNVIAVPAFKDVWPQINKAIFDSLPQNQADGPKPDELKKMPRATRNQVFVDAMVSKYYPDLNLVLTTNDLAPYADLTGVATIPGGGGLPGGIDFGGGAQPSMPTFGSQPGMTPGAPAPTPHRGYIITIKISTPNSAPYDVFQKVNTALTNLAATTDRSFEFRDPKNINVVQIKANPARMQELITGWRNRQQLLTNPNGVMPGYPSPGGYPAPGGYPGGGGKAGMSSTYPPPTPAGGGFGAPGAGGTAEQIPEEAYKDPAVNEDIRGDTEAVLVVAVVLDPPPKPATPAAPGTTPPAKVAMAQ